jgi:hypothetical protein
MNWSGMRQAPGPGQLEQEAVRDQSRELDEATERERAVETAVPHHHPIRAFLARFRRKR